MGPLSYMWSIVDGNVIWHMNVVTDHPWVCRQISDTSSACSQGWKYFRCSQCLQIQMHKFQSFRYKMCPLEAQADKHYAAIQMCECWKLRVSFINLYMFDQKRKEYSRKGHEREDRGEILGHPEAEVQTWVFVCGSHIKHLSCLCSQLLCPILQAAFLST